MYASVASLAALRPFLQAGSQAHTRTKSYAHARATYSTLAPKRGPPGIHRAGFSQVKQNARYTIYIACHICSWEEPRRIG